MTEKDFLDAISDVRLDEVTLDQTGRIIITNAAAAERISGMVDKEPEPNLTVRSVNFNCRPTR
ncbi:hypothetical protein [Streptomyces sp. NRRL F-2580]|uniref:hypothetical protein n=1 Tax=Streptomyces sp. NRRL F-2580 TaxID=1463841 RepID=UPI0004C59FF9|nr:hypothetical protein [Streptomyces sp. NRRL F-2580]